MTLHQFSLLLAILSITTLSAALLFLLMLGLSSAFRKWELRTLSYEKYMQAIGFLAIFSTVMVLVYQLHYDLEVCELCWWQRIFMFPIDIIALTSLWYSMRKNHISILILALFGVFFAGYHYYYHFRGWVLGELVSLPCEVGGLLPACTDNNGILAFGFLTIPGMAFFIFIVIAILAVLAHRKS